MKFEGFLTFDENIDDATLDAWFQQAIPRMLPGAKHKVPHPGINVIDHEGEHVEFVPASKTEFADIFAMHEDYAQRLQGSMYIVYYYPNSTTLNVILYHLAKRWRFIWSFAEIPNSSEELQQWMAERLNQQP